MLVPPNEVSPVPPDATAKAVLNVRAPLALIDRADCDDVAYVVGDEVAM